MDSIKLKMKDLELEIRRQAYQEVVDYVNRDKELQKSPAGERLCDFLVKKYASLTNEKLDVTLQMMMDLTTAISKAE